MRKGIATLMLILITLNLTACYDAREIDDLLHVIVMGVDQGISDKWRLTIQFPTMSSGGGGGSGGSSGGSEGPGGYTTVTIDAPTFFTGIDMLNASLPRKINFFHAQTIVFSEDLAKSGLIGEYIAPINRFRQIRRSAHILVVKGKASDFLTENKPFIGSAISKNFEILASESDDTGYFPHVTLEKFYTGLKSSYQQPTASLAAVNDFSAYKKEGELFGTEFKTGGDYVAGELPRTGENKIELFGTALFDGDTMVGELTGDETRYMLIANGEFKRGSFTIQDPQKPDLAIPLDTRGPTDPEIRINFDGVKPLIHLKVHLSADILAIQSRLDYEKPELRVLLEKEFQKTVKDGIEKVIKKCQSLNADVFMFGEQAVKEFPTIDDLENYNWNSHFKDAVITVEVEFTIRRTGTQINSSPMRNSKGAE